MSRIAVRKPWWGKLYGKICTLFRIEPNERMARLILRHSDLPIVED